MRSIFGGLSGMRRERPSRVVYTCMFGHSEAFADRHFDRDNKTDFICFTDDRSLRSKRWQFSYVDTAELGPVRTSKMVKLLPHRFVRGYSSSLYLDNTVEPKVPAQRFFELLGSSPEPMLCFRHPERHCVYDEAAAVIGMQLDDPDVVGAQMRHYRALGYPAEAGLITASALLRRHNDPAVTTVMEAWAAEVRQWSYRDQLSFNVVARQLGFQPGYIAGTPLENALLVWPRVKGHRLPRGFRDEDYLRLNPDVAASGINPRKHYVVHGAAEGRRWK